MAAEISLRSHLRGCARDRFNEAAANGRGNRIDLTSPAAGTSVLQ